MIIVKWPMIILNVQPKNWAGFPQFRQTYFFDAHLGLKGDAWGMRNRRFVNEP